MAPRGYFTLKQGAAPELSEAEFTRQVRDLLAHYGYLLVRNHVGVFVPYRVVMEALNRMEHGLPKAAAMAIVNTNTIKGCDEGTADWFAIHPEKRTVLLELKRRGKQLREAQTRWLDYMLTKRGFLGGCYDNIDSLLTWLKHNDNL